MVKELRILILEDVPTDAELIERELRKAKIAFRSKRVETRDSFVKELREFMPDLILSDYSLPQFDGMAALLLAKKLAPSVPLIIVTGPINEETAVECMKAGAADYVLKDRLVRIGPAVKGALEKTRARAEKERAEKKLRQSEERFRRLVEQSLVGIYIIQDDRFQYVNPKVAEMFGYTREEIEASISIFDLIAEDFHPVVAEAIRQRLNGEVESVHYSFRGRRKDGTLIDCEAHGTITEFNGKPAIIGTVLDTTERKRAEEQIRLLSHAIRCVNECIGITDLDNRIIFVNQAFERTFGYAIDELIGRDMRMLRPDSDTQGEDDNIFMETLKGGWQGEIWNQRKDGTPIPLWLSTSVIRDEQGNPLALVGVSRDITERKRTEEALGRLQQQTSQLVGELDVDRMVQGILDAARVIVGADLAALPVLSDDGAELRYRAAEGEGAEVLVGRKLPLTAPSLCTMAVREREPVRSDNLMNDPRMSRELAESLGMGTGISVPLIKGDQVLGALTLLRRQGSFTEEEGRLLTIFTNYVVGLIESARLYEQMRQAEARYRDLYNNAPDGYDSVDADGVIREMNATMLNWLGYRREEVIGKTKFVDMLTPEGQRQFGHLLERCRREGHLEGVELEMVGKDEKRLPVRVNMAMTRDAEGRDQGFRATVREISKEKELEAQLLQAQKLESLGTLVGGIAHDFNNMLTGILGYTQLLLRAMRPEGKVYEQIRRIELLGERAADMVNQLLTFSREEVSRKRSLELHPFLKELVKLLRHTIPESIEVELRLAVERLMVVADPTQLQQVVMNLAINARDAMPEGGRLRLETARVQLDEEFCRTHPDVVPGSYVRLSISDTGEGIAPGIRGRIFDPFFTTKEVGKGTGLGLAVVYGIVKKHGGVIEVKSEVGRGTRVEVTLPAAEVAEAVEAGAMKEAKGGTETILLVEDETVVLELGRMVLEEFGYRVLTAQNGEEAVTVYRDRGNEIALVILDMVMPKMGGLEALRQLQRLNPDVKVLMTTGYGNAEQTPAEIAEAGVCGLLRKPYQVDELARTVRAALDESE